MNFKGIMEPAFAITDKMSQMLEQGQLRYLGWSECPSRQDELLSIKVDRFWKPDSSGTMKEILVNQAVTADTSTDLKLMQALTRRGIAFHMSHLMEFKTHELLKAVLMEELAREPPSSDYAWITVAQLERADKEIFRRLSEACRGGLAPNGFGLRPLDEHMQTCLDSTSVRVMLMHPPVSAGAKRAAPTTEHKGNEGKALPGEGQSAKAKKRARAKANMEAAIRAGQKSKGFGKRY
jgi:hypothetical protein